MFVDSHCHLDRLKSATSVQQVAEIVQAARDAQVEHMLCVNVVQSEYQAMRDMCDQFADVSFSIGVHPCHVHEGFNAEFINQHASDNRVVAIGETGLDYYYSKDNQAQQIAALDDHISIARNHQKPLIIHTRDAREDTIERLRVGQAHDCRGVLHCFTESYEMAKQALDLDFYISFSGIVTFKNAKELQEVARKVPLDRILIETDSPYLAPVPKRGKENQPAYVSHVGQFLADLKGVHVKELAAQTTANFYELFKGAKTA
ncbi:TatD family hydrolase [Paraferrimonas sp. SM1919]|uniref:TatD family hydrolase n=1 Tax=Paraferrimonas sp. SM1919 TaxID=2662263 RepID=UPI0013D1F981|nr:TatD family hydrolase [Paraferrimonas sp. SM1919]